MHYIITGGTGYIGSHMAALLHKQGHRITLIDNFSNSDDNALNRLQALCNKKLHFDKVDIRDHDALDNSFSLAMQREPATAVLHFAGLKAVGESSQKPIAYYQNNVSGTLTLCEIMQKYRIWSLVFSSSATVYGQPEKLPLDEHCATRTTNPYGASKLMCENILKDIAMSHPSWRMAILRYFNPAGAHPSGKIGESPSGTPNNLMPYVFDVACGKRESVQVFGNDYNTPDGTGIRDYIHVMDLVEGHAAALRYLETNKGADVFNLGCGQGHSVMSMINHARKITGRKIPYTIAPRRTGDLGEVYANTKKANALLHWKATRGLDDMIADQWRWEQMRNNA